MKNYIAKLIEDAILEAANGLSMDKEHTIRFVERNVPGVKHHDAVKEVNKFFNKKYKVTF